MELNAEQIKSELEGLVKFRTCPEYIRNALSLINSQEQRIKELTQAHEMLSESYDHLEKTKDELLSERARLTEENERLRNKVTATIILTDKDAERIKTECLEKN